MSRVFVTQLPRPRRRVNPNTGKREYVEVDLTPALEYGSLEYLSESWDQVIYGGAPVVRQIGALLQDFSDDDYLMGFGDPAVMMIASAYAAKYNEGRFKVLKWDREEQKYYVVSVDLSRKVGE